MRTLTDWAVVTDPFKAPELASFCAYGICGGERIRTSLIVRVINARSFVTASGTEYRLDGPGAEITSETQCETEEPLVYCGRCLEIQDEG